MIRLFSILIPTTIVGLLISEIMLVFGMYFLASALTVENGIYLFLVDEDGWPRLSVVVASVIGGLHFNDFYTNIRIRSRAVLVQQVCLTIGVAFLIQAAIAYFNVTWRMPRKAMLLGSVAAILILPVWRIFYNIVVLRILGAEKLLLVGASPSLEKVAVYLEEHPELGLAAAGLVSDHPPKPGFGLAGIPYFGEVADLANAVQRLKPSRLIVGLEPGEEKELHGLLDVRQHGLRVEDVAQIYETSMGRVCLNRIRAEDLFFSNRFSPRQRNLILNSVYTFALALVGLVIALPIMLVVAILVRITSKGPVLFRQRRVGLNNTTFTLYKFRSMYVDAEARTGAVWAQANDPRVTTLGRWLRMLRLDELPQLFNVLKGEMAIVGPRPERPEFVKPLAEKIPYYLHRHLVKPGITGWAQINYRYGNTIEDTVVKLEYDLYYIKNISPLLDLVIMFHTVKTMILTRGAY